MANLLKQRFPIRQGLVFPNLLQNPSDINVRLFTAFHQSISQAIQPCTLDLQPTFRGVEDFSRKLSDLFFKDGFIIQIGRIRLDRLSKNISSDLALCNIRGPFRLREVPSVFDVQAILGVAQVLPHQHNGATPHPLSEVKAKVGLTHGLMIERPFSRPVLLQPVVSRHAGIERVLRPREVFDNLMIRRRVKHQRHFLGNIYSSKLPVCHFLRIDAQHKVGDDSLHEQVAQSCVRRNDDGTALCLFEVMDVFPKGWPGSDEYRGDPRKQSLEL